MNETAYPLYWPKGYPRTRGNDRIFSAPFSVGETYDKTENRWENGTRTSIQVKKQRNKEVSVALASERVDDQLRLLDADHPVLSTNLELRRDGAPRADRRPPDDPGAAIWFTLKGKRMVIACDKWERTADNIAALAATIRATRSLERYGAVTVEQAFRGYQALPDPTMPMNWRDVLGNVSLTEAESIFRERAKRMHPDVGGNPVQMAQLNAAIAEARTELNPSVPAG